MIKKESVHISIAIEHEAESKVLVDLLKGEGWKVQYQCVEDPDPKFISTQLFRTKNHKPK
jgi:hypothetical protein